MVQPMLPPLSPSPGSSAPSSPSRRGSPTSSSPPKADEALPKIGGYPAEAAAAPPPPPPLALVPAPPPPGEAEDGGDATGGEAEEAKEEAKEVGKAAPLRGLDLLRRMSKKIPVVLYADWKAANNLKPDARVFVVSGPYPDVREAFLRRGLVENVWDPEGTNFDLKWTRSNEDLDFDRVMPNQVINHFERILELCTKVRLHSHLQDARFFCEDDACSFFPECFNLNSLEETEEFTEQFKVLFAQSVLRRWLEHREGKSREATFTEGVVRVALSVVQRSRVDIDSLLGGEEDAAEQPAFKLLREEWAVLEETDLNDPGAENKAFERLAEEREKKGRAVKETQQLKTRAILALQQQAEALRKRREKEAKKLRRAASLGARPYKPPASGGRAAAASPAAPPLSRMEDAESDEGAAREEGLTGPELVSAVRGTLRECAAHPQHALRGDSNIWILKPSGRARGEGIFLSDNLPKILESAGRKRGSIFGNHYIAQKYIENPLLIDDGRKFDIRQWAVVSSVNPLTVWFFNDCYIRLAANKYSTDDISDTCTHLTNNSIVCHHENFDKEDPYWMCMWDLDTFKAFLRKKYGPGTDKWAEKVLPAMKHAVVATLSCVAEKLAESDSSGQSFELLGFDFMIDTDLKVWLLEVNTAPCMQPSTPITARLVGPALDDCVRLMLQKADGRDPEEADAEASGDELRFELLHRGPEVPARVGNLSHDLCVQGKAIAPPPPPEKVVTEEELRAAQRRATDRAIQQVQEVARRRQLQEEKERKRSKKRKDAFKGKGSKKASGRHSRAAKTPRSAGEPEEAGDGDPQGPGDSDDEDDAPEEPADDDVADGNGRDSLRGALGLVSAR
mmetsp:Transcript_89336/g.193370  ORF Transcript_89336/g.193370 Transcript_89336/m.193370 type:complete len:849 (-) Transcript_89336:175-2721(-)